MCECSLGKQLARRSRPTMMHENNADLYDCVLVCVCARASRPYYTSQLETFRSCCCPLTAECINIIGREELESTAAAVGAESVPERTTAS
jgi:hypothetical protein